MVNEKDIARLKQEQKKLAKKIVLADSISDVKTIAGCDIACTGNNIICVIVVMDLQTLKIRETKYFFDKIRFPHIDGLESYRDAKVLIETYHALELDPDILLIDGTGICHSAGIGLASHIGLSLDKCSIGVTKEFNVGKEENGTIFLKNRSVAKTLNTKELAKPIIISPGHKISLETSYDIIKSLIRDHKMPEPLHQAHKVANKIRRKLRNGGKVSVDEESGVGFAEA